MSIDTYFCFCCLSTNDLSLIYTGAEANQGNMLLQLFNLNISYEDYEYDGYICKDCGQKIKDAYQFKVQVFDILNILQNSGLIELSNVDHQMFVKKPSSDNTEVEIKYNELIKEPTTFKVVEEPIKKIIPVKTETSELTKISKLDASSSRVDDLKITQYDVTDDLKCPLCSKELPNVYVYHKHMNEHFPNHICDTCGKGYLTEKRLKRHLSSHNTGPFKCQTCEAEFSNYNTFNSHRQRQHSSVEQYRCPHCSERFATMTRRARHLAAAHGRPAWKYQCEICNKRFLLSGNLSSHIRNSHHKVTRHWCSDCGSGFNQKQDLTAHISTHTGLSMFKCTICPKRYSRKKALTVHMRTHNEDRRFPCEHCGKRFIQKCTLIVHLKTHNRTEKTVN